MVDVSEIARCTPGERTLRLGGSEGGKKSGKKNRVVGSRPVGSGSERNGIIRP